MVLPADKGRASVVLEADTHHAKMSVLIDSGPYQLLNKDPTKRLTRKLSEKLLTLKRMDTYQTLFIIRSNPNTNSHLGSMD